MDGIGVCGAECEVNHGGECAVRVMLREIYSRNPKSGDGKKHLLVPASDGSSSSGSSGAYGGDFEMNDDGAKRFLVPASDGPSAFGGGGGGKCGTNDDAANQHLVPASGDTSDDGCRGECKMNEDGANQFFAMASDGSTDSSLFVLDPPPREEIQLSSSDDDDISTRESCRDDGCGGECRMNEDGAKQVLTMASDGSTDSSLFVFDPPPREEIDLSSSDDDDIGTRESCRMQKRVTRSCAKTQKITSTSSPSTRSGYRARKTHDDQAPVKLGVGSEPSSNNLGGAHQRPYLLSRFVKLSLQERKKVEEKVQELGSDHPIFVKRMSKDNVDGVGCKTCELVFCAAYAKACLPAERVSQTLLLQLEGEGSLWETTFDVRIVDKLRRIHRGWKKFSQENALELGDICLFKPEDTNINSLRMSVHIIRKAEVDQ